MEMKNLVIKGKKALYDCVAQGEPFTSLKQAGEWYRKAAEHGAETLYVTAANNAYFKCVSESDAAPMTAEEFQMEWEEEAREASMREKAFKLFGPAFLAKQDKLKSVKQNHAEQVGEKVAAAKTVSQSDLTECVRKEVKRLLEETIARL